MVRPVGHFNAKFKFCGESLCLHFKIFSNGFDKTGFMRLRSGRLVSMSRNTSQNQSSSTNNVVHVKENATQPMCSGGNMSTSVGVTAPAASQAVKSTAGPEMVVSQPHVTATPTTPLVTQLVSLGPRPTASQQLSFPQVTRDYPYGMPYSFMVGFQTSPSTYADNSLAVFSPFHPHNASGSAINNCLQVSQLQAGLGMAQ